MSLIIAVLGLSEPAQAVSIFFQPQSSGNVQAGQTYSEDVYITGLQALGNGDSSLGAFSLDINFAPNLLQFQSITFGGGLGDIAAGEAISGITFPSSVGGLLSIYEVSLLEGSATNCSFCTGPYLDSLQSNSFVLATLSFNGLATGAALFSADNVVLGDANGNPIPEPGTFSLLAIGIALLGWVYAMMDKRAKRYSMSAI